jgi:hypothetical protein
MKNLTTPLLLTASWILASGCVVSIGGNEKTHQRQEVPKPSPVVVVAANTEDSATLAEIDAITKLAFDNGKRDGFMAVASRGGISPGVQVHLVNTALRSLSFDAAKVEVLVQLTQNPTFSPAAKEAILRQIDLLAFESSKTTVLNAIQERAKTP